MKEWFHDLNIENKNGKAGHVKTKRIIKVFKRVYHLAFY
jgi:hypothetical protein